MIIVNTNFWMHKTEVSYFGNNEEEHFITLLKVLDHGISLVITQQIG